MTKIVAWDVKRQHKQYKTKIEHVYTYVHPSMYFKWDVSIVLVLTFISHPYY